MHDRMAVTYQEIEKGQPRPTKQAQRRKRRFVDEALMQKDEDEGWG